MGLSLATFVHDFADALVAIDSEKRVHKAFQPGIGPFGEADAVRLVTAYLAQDRPALYRDARIMRLPDLFIPGEWAIELKIIRPFGDNGRPAEHWSENVLHPYGGNTSSIGDCLTGC